MKPERLIAAAAALVGCAVACGIYVSRHPTPDQTTPTLSAKTKSSVKKHSATLLSEPQLRTKASDRPTQNRPLETSENSRPLSHLIAGTPPYGRSAVLPESQWRANAAQVEQESNHELARLTNLLDLDSKQQAQVFSALARNSPYWLPGMQAGEKPKTGTPKTSAPAVTQPPTGSETTALPAPVVPGVPSVTAGSGLTDVAAVLNADQQLALVQDEMDRQAWWAEVLPQLLPPALTDDSAAVPIMSSPTDTVSPPSTKEFIGGDVLIEE